MPGESRHFTEELQELLDQRLTAETQARVEAHLTTCEQCRREFEALSWTKQFSQESFTIPTVPAGVEQGIRQVLDREDNLGSAGTLFSRLWHRLPILAYGLPLLIVGIATLFYLLKTPDLPVEVAQDFHTYQSERLPLDLTTEDVAFMENYFAEQGIAFETRVFDLGMMNYGLVGGRIHELVGRKSAFFVYRGEGDRVLVCQMYPGQPGELPEAAEQREHNDIQFYVFHRDRVTMVFWQEGDIICVLASDVDDPEEVIQLAFGKAVKI